MTKSDLSEVYRACRSTIDERIDPEGCRELGRDVALHLSGPSKYDNEHFIPGKSRRKVENVAQV